MPEPDPDRRSLRPTRSPPALPRSSLRRVWCSTRACGPTAAARPDRAEPAWQRFQHRFRSRPRSPPTSTRPASHARCSQTAPRDAHCGPSGPRRQAGRRSRSAASSLIVGVCGTGSPPALRCEPTALGPRREHCGPGRLPQSPTRHRRHRRRPCSPTPAGTPTEATHPIRSRWRWVVRVRRRFCR